MTCNFLVNSRRGQVETPGPSLYADTANFMLQRRDGTLI